MEMTAGQRTPISFPDGSQSQTNEAKGDHEIGLDFGRTLHWVRNQIPDSSQSHQREDVGFNVQEGFSSRLQSGMPDPRYLRF